MMQDRLTCEDCRKLGEAYLSEELEGAEARLVEAHVRDCTECSAALAADRQLIESLRAVPSLLDPPALSAAYPYRRASTETPWRFAASVAAAIAMVSLSALSVPAFATQIPGLPTTKRLQNLEHERVQLQSKNENLMNRVEQLEVRVKNLGGEQVRVVDTAPGDVSPEVNDQVQLLVMEFIRAQYKADVATMKSLASGRLDKEITSDPDLFTKKVGKVVFVQMTTVSESGNGALLVFVRLSDEQFSDSSYQQNFEVKQDHGTYVIDFVGMDA